MFADPFQFESHQVMIENLDDVCAEGKETAVTIVVRHELLFPSSFTGMTG
jgi:hypothetical protein